LRQGHSNSRWQPPSGQLILYSQTQVDSKVDGTDLGGGQFAPFHISASDDWWKILELNLRAPADLIRAVLPSMLERNNGTIICTTSRAAIGNLPYSTVFPDRPSESDVVLQCFKSGITPTGGDIERRVQQN
jgi:hypothetical protein